MEVAQGSPALDGLSRRAGETDRPLLPAQQAQWEVMRALWPDDPGRSRRIVFDCRHFDGMIDEAALIVAFSDLVRRHDGLRAVFVDTGDDPVMRVHADAEPPVEFRDLSGLGESRAEAAAEELAFHEVRRAFDLRNGPLWHAYVLRLSARSHWVLFSLSHVIADGWSAKVFVDDLLAAYAARTGEGPPLPDDVPGLDEVHRRQSQRLRITPDRLRYWRERLPREHRPEPFPTPHDADLLSRNAIGFSLPAGMATEIRRLAWRARTTPFVALFAAHHVQLAVSLDRSRTVISTASLDGVTAAERRAICQHASDPYVCLDVDDHQSLLDIVRNTHAALTDAIANLVPFTAIAREVNPDFGAHRPWPDTHLFDGNFIDSAFVLGRLTVPGAAVVRPPLRVKPPPGGYTPDLTWARLPEVSRPAWERLSGPGFELNSRRDGGVVHYNDHMISPRDMQAFVESYVWIVHHLASGPDEPLGALRRRYTSRFRKLRHGSSSM